MLDEGYPFPETSCIKARLVPTNYPIAKFSWIRWLGQHSMV